MRRAIERGIAAAAGGALVFAASAALLFAGCTSGEPSEGAYFPMVPGTRWIYEVRSARGVHELEVTARGRMPLTGHSAAFVMDEATRGPRLGFVETSPVAYVLHEGYVARIPAVAYAESGELRRLGDDEPTQILPLDPRPGHRWRQRTTLFRTPEGGGAPMGWSAEVKPLTSVAVPAGRFERVVEVESLYRGRSDGEAEPRVRYRDYYARGVGLVRSVAEDPSGDPSKRVELRLLDHRPPTAE